jgi:hypothetical protein
MTASQLLSEALERIENAFPNANWLELIEVLIPLIMYLIERFFPNAIRSVAEAVESATK